jgi:preprotein translocase subunit SecG
LNILLSIVLVIQVLAALGVIVLVLLQHGKGADMGAAFGSGASGSLFGATGSANFLSRTTAALATVFFVCTLALSYLSSHREAAPRSVMEQSEKAGGAAPGGASSASPGSEIPKSGDGAAKAGASAADSAKATDGKADANPSKSGQPSDIPK